MEPDILKAITDAADIYRIPHKDMAYAIHVALNVVARSRPGYYDTNCIKLMALADEFYEFT
jgi:hypothetical protein